MNQFEFETELLHIKMDENSAMIDFQKQKNHLRSEHKKNIAEIESEFHNMITELLFDVATIAGQIAATTDIETRGRLIFKERSKQNDITNLRLSHDSRIKNTVNIYNDELDKISLAISEKKQEYDRRRMELRKQFAAECRVCNPTLETANWDGEAHITKE